MKDNFYIKNEITKMLSALTAFEEVCEKAATSDDNRVSRQEKRDLAEIHKAAQEFRRRLEKVEK